MQTAKELHHIHKESQFHLIPKLSERSWGDLEGISSSEMYDIEEQEDNDPSHTPGHQVEPRSVFRQRINEAIIHAQTLHSHPLIVSHGRVFAELCHLLGVPPIQQIPNCQLVKLIPNEKSWEIHLF